MIKPGETIVSPRTGSTFELVEWRDDGVVFERLYKPNTGKSDPHVHFDFIQRWQVVEGTVRGQLDGEEYERGAGEEIATELGVPHQDPWNPGPGEARIRWEIPVMNEFIRSYADAFTHLFAAGKLNKQDEFKTLQILVVLHASRAESYITGVPIGLQKALLPLGAAIGRLRGYRPFYS